MMSKHGDLIKFTLQIKLQSCFFFKLRMLKEVGYKRALLLLLLLLQTHPLLLRIAVSNNRKAHFRYDVSVRSRLRVHADTFMMAVL